MENQSSPKDRLKWCKKCQAFTERYSNPNNNRCKPCLRNSVKKWKIDNPEATESYLLKWQKDNRDKILKQGREWYNNNTEKAKENVAKWIKANPDKVKRYARANREANSEKIKIRIKAWEKANEEAVDNRKIKHELRKKGIINPPEELIEVLVIRREMNRTNILIKKFKGENDDSTVSNA